MSKEEEKEEEEEKLGLWQRLLRDASSSNRDDSLSSTLILCGDADAGKRSLLKAIGALNEDEVSRGFGYTFHEHDGDMKENLEAWWLSERSHEGVLMRACPEDESGLLRTAFAICLNLSEPGKIKSSLESWMKLIENILKKKIESLSMDERDSLSESSRKRYSEYGKEASSSSKENLEVPIVIVCTQSDSLVGGGLNIRQMSWLQWWLRRFCLSKGLGLICTSAKLGVNCDVLKQYVIHCAHKCGTKFDVAPQVTNLERLFIPIGADALQALDVLLQSSGMNAESEFESVCCQNSSSSGKKDENKDITKDSKKNNSVEFAAPSAFLESLKILSDAQDKTLKPRKILTEIRTSSSSSSSSSSKKNQTKEKTDDKLATADVPVADQKELSSFFQSLINTKSGGTKKTKKKTSTSSKRSTTRRVMTRSRARKKQEK